jgi:cyanophycinase-like exopeptidase
VAEHRDQLADRLRRVSALLIAGGHVAVLLNRLRLFGVLDLAHGLPVVAWSAGAMVLTERILLFHDSPPQGAGNAEMLDVGLGRCDGIVALPHASSRLRLDDPVRVATLARRVAPAVAVALDPGARVDAEGSRWRPAPGTRALLPSGDVREATP